MSKFSNNSSAAATSNEVIEDFLEVDPPIHGQNFACMSFVTPYKVIKNKEVYKCSKFMEELFTSEDRQIKELREKMQSGEKSEFSYEKVNEMYENWKYSRDQKLEDDFHKIQNFQTSIMGIKVRGVYSTEAEARVRAKKLQQMDKNFNVYVTNVGYWAPIDPNPDAIQDQEHQEQQLNTLVKEYFNNQAGKDELYQKVKQDQIERSRRELEERKQRLKEETEMSVPESNTEDIKNVEELRKIVDESDAVFYSTTKKQYDEQKSDETKVESMTNLETDDPWIQRKKQQEASKETQSEESA